jgi:radical SAM superfamily enzyme YgiQ (UPF0313 family)
LKILLIRPPRIKQSITVSDFMFSEPLGLEMIYGILEVDHIVEIFDMMVEKISLEEKLIDYKPNVVGITSLCIDVNKVNEMGMKIKEFDKTIVTVVGGTQSYLNPKAYYNRFIDHIFQYTSSENLKMFYNEIDLNYLSKPIDGILSRQFDYKSTGKPGRNEYLLPNRNSTEKYRSQYSYFGYRPAAIMEFGIGCEKTCDFCLRWRIEGSKESLIDLDIIKEDLVQIKEPTIMFIDNDFFANEEKILMFLELIKQLDINKNFIVYGSVNGIIKYEKLIKEFVGLGLKAILVGYESFKESELIKYRKKSTIDDNYIAAKILRDMKVDVWASFMAHPDWNKQDFKDFRKYINSLKPQIASINPLTPFPNLPLYKEYEDRLLYTDEDYEKWSFGQVIIKPSAMSLRKYYWELLKTNLYVNLFTNNKTEMLKHFGIGNMVRLVIGSLGSLKKYILLMVGAVGNK